MQIEQAIFCLRRVVAMVRILLCGDVRGDVPKLCRAGCNRQPGVIGSYTYILYINYMQWWMIIWWYLLELFIMVDACWYDGAYNMNIMDHNGWYIILICNDWWYMIHWYTCWSKLIHLLIWWWMIIALVDIMVNNDGLHPILLVNLCLRIVIVIFIFPVGN